MSNRDKQLSLMPKPATTNIGFVYAMLDISKKYKVIKIGKTTRPFKRPDEIAKEHNDPMLIYYFAQFVNYEHIEAKLKACLKHKKLPGKHKEKFFFDKESEYIFDIIIKQAEETQKGPDFDKYMRHFSSFTNTIQCAERSLMPGFFAKSIYDRQYLIAEKEGLEQKIDELMQKMHGYLRKGNEKGVGLCKRLVLLYTDELNEKIEEIAKMNNLINSLIGKVRTH